MKNLRYVRMESIKEREIGFTCTRLSVKEKRVKKCTDRTTYFKLLRALAQTVPSIAQTPMA